MVVRETTLSQIFSWLSLCHLIFYSFIAFQCLEYTYFRQLYVLGILQVDAISEMNEKDIADDFLAFVFL